MRDETAFQTTRAGEKDTLTAYLRFHQDTVLTKVAGLDADALRKPVVPSGLSLIGLLKHLTYVHARWFEMCFSNETPTDLPWPTNEWIAEEEGPAEVIEAYRHHVEKARTIIEAADLDEPNLGWAGGGWQPGQFNLRWILVHMIEELARHNGHADILREQIDGTTGV